MRVFLLGFFDEPAYCSSFLSRMKGMFCVTLNMFYVKFLPCLRSGVLADIKQTQNSLTLQDKKKKTLLTYCHGFADFIFYRFPSTVQEI